MIGKKSKPVIGMLTGRSLVSGNRSETVAVATSSSRSQFDPKALSPKGMKNFDLGGVGLGIVAALENRNEIPGRTALFGRNLSRSNPIPVTSPRNLFATRSGCSDEEMETGSLEEYTIVTRHTPNKSYTKVYNRDGRNGGDRSPFRIPSGGAKNSRTGVFHISPAICGDAGIPPSDFLSSCNLCQKKLHGKDIYMYRGEKAFCSTECRYRQIVMDERKEKCSSGASRPPAAVEMAGSSPYATGQMFTTGILAI